jgi:hypothetical protein
VIELLIIAAGAAGLALLAWFFPIGVVLIFGVIAAFAVVVAVVWGVLGYAQGGP